MHALRSFCAAVALLAIGSIAPGCASAPPTPAPEGPARPDADARTGAVADAIVDDNFEHAPDLVARLLPPGAHHDKLPDESRKAREARDAREDGWAAELRAIDRATLRSPSAKLAYDIASETLAARHDARVCRFPLWSVGQMTGWQVRFANLAQAQPVGTETARREALARFAAVPAYVATQIDNLREGLGLGYSQAAVNVKQVITQLDHMLASPPDKSPFASPADRDGDAAFRAAWLALVEKDVNPSLTKYRDFLRDEYLPKARAGIGVSANPDGAACYRAAIRSTTTLALDPTEVHKAGERELAHIQDEMRVVAKRAFGTDDLPAVLKRLSSDPEFLHHDRDSVTAQAKQAMTRAEAALPRVFGLLPRTQIVVEPIPAYQERTSSAHYLPAALDGSRPATYRIRLFEAEKQSLSTGESTAFHEAVPGHHLQFDIALQRADNPRIARFLFNSGFGEGWALYAERLADELGLYSNDASRLGWLSNAAWRAVRLMVDTGIHAFGWDRQRAIDALRASTVLGEEQAAQEIDRYISWPGQATAYMVGYLEIAKLRSESESRLGKRFDLKAFHDRVLENGAVPLPVLRRYVEAWQGAEAAAGGPAHP